MVFDVGKDDAEGAERYYEELKSLSQAHADDGDFRAQLSDAAEWFICDYLAVDGFERAEQLYRDIEVLAEAYPDDSVVRLSQAVAASHLIHDFLDHDARENAMEEAQKLRHVVRTLALNHTAEEELQEAARDVETLFDERA